MNEGNMENRRPLASRGTRWAQRVTQLLCQTNITPNQVSVLSVVFAGIAGVLFYVSGGAAGSVRIVCLLSAGVFVQLRLLCNLFDGLLAVEAGRSSPDGGVYNELPDRFADIAIFVGIGYGLGEPQLGWAAGAMAVFTAYVRELGHGLGAGVDFGGPQAKPHRMAVVTLGAVLAILETLFLDTRVVMLLCLWVVAVGSAITVLLRTQRLIKKLKAAN
ncbi:MAG: CDP-alcohol phosphatidyltransferase family protein [Gammaproteobacteria bacterium]|nr:CDP-alcohol phosphatidyltransferase family protein [Gammaproteobacteria bacterium]